MKLLKYALPLLCFIPCFAAAERAFDPLDRKPPQNINRFDDACARLAADVLSHEIVAWVSGSRSPPGDYPNVTDGRIYVALSVHDCGNSPHIRVCQQAEKMISTPDVDEQRKALPVTLNCNGGVKKFDGACVRLASHVTSGQTIELAKGKAPAVYPNVIDGRLYLALLVHDCNNVAQAGVCQTIKELISQPSLAESRRALPMPLSCIAGTVERDIEPFRLPGDPP